MGKLNNFALRSKFKYKNNASTIGFSLIELMVVVAIIGILSSIAIPAYDNYMIKSKLSHLLTAGQTMKRAITEARSLNGAFPVTIDQVYNTPSDPYINAYYTPGGCGSTGTNYTFHIEGQSIYALVGPRIQWAASWNTGSGASGGGVVWTCTYLMPTGGPNEVPAGSLPGCNVVTSLATVACS